FRNALMRDAVAQTVPGPLRVGVHHAALTYYRCSVGMADAVRLPRLAWHAAQAGQHAEAAETYVRLAEEARLRHNYLEAELLYTRALEHLGAQEESARLAAFRGRGIMRYRVGRYDNSLADFAAARDLALRFGDAATQAEILLDEAMALDWLDEARQS